MTIQLVLREWANLPSIKSSLLIKENRLDWNYLCNKKIVVYIPATVTCP